MKNLKDYIWGLLLILAGIIFGINALGIAKINIFFQGWWTLFIIIPSLLGLIEGNDKKGSLIFLVIGILLLLGARDIIDFAILGRLILPAILIILGLSIIFKKTNDRAFDNIEMDKSSDEVSATFKEQNIKAEEEVKGKYLSAVFGKITYDLRDAKIKKDTLIKAEAIFGSIEILIPEGYKVKTKNTAIFGSVTNNKLNEESNKIIYIEATSIFGGIEIK